MSLFFLFISIFSKLILVTIFGARISVVVVVATAAAAAVVNKSTLF